MKEKSWHGFRKPPERSERKGSAMNKIAMIPKIDADEKGLLKKINCFALDMDGTVYLGEKWIDGARDFLQAVEDAGNLCVSHQQFLKKSGELSGKTGRDGA